MADSIPNTDDPKEIISFVEELKRQWVSTIDAIQDPLMWVSSDYNIQKANLAVAKLGDTDIRKVVGQKCYKIFADRDSPCENCTLKSTLKNNAPTNFELKRVQDEKYYEVSSQPMIASDSQSVVHVYRDRTEAKKLQDQLLQQEKLASIGLLAGGIAHEINNPLGGILIFSQMLLKEMDKEIPHYQDVVEIEAATQRCKAIVENLLEFARQRPSRLQKKKPFSTTDAIEKALKFARVGPDSKQIEIIKQYKEQDFSLIGEENKLIQVFLNLFTNAFQAMPEGGSLTIETKAITKGGRPHGTCLISDTGDGISAKNLNKIFDPFFTTKEPGEGTGLGLSICFKIVQDFDGLLEVANSSDNGTTFKITLPLKEK